MRRVRTGAAVPLICAALFLTGCGSGSPPPLEPTITSIAVTCAASTVTAGGTVQCTAVVHGTGNFNPNVTWQASAGTISNTGLFTAPATAGPVAISATAVGNASRSASTTITVTVPPAITGVTISCPQVALPMGQSQQCAATVQGTGAFDRTVTWRASAGTISSTGLFTAPNETGEVTVTATANGDPSKSASTVIAVTVPSNITGVVLNCPEASLPEGLAELCRATVQGTGTFLDTVAWTVTAGSITQGLFTAPDVATTVTITATSVEDPTKAANAMVEVRAAQQATFEYKGINHVSWWLDEYTSAAAAPSETALAATGATWAGVLTTQYMPTRTSTTIGPTNNTPTDAAIISAIRELHNHSVKVMLKPHVDVSDGAWRGDIAPSNVDDWFASFKTFILRYAELAEANRVEMLCFGTEFRTLSGANNLARWTDVINSIRAVYRGKLAYAANATSAGDEFTSVAFWDQVDVIGLDGYFPLTDHADPTITELVSAWNSNLWRFNIVAAVTNFANAYPTKPVVFTEIGYRSQAGANTAPWDWSQSGTADNLEQQNCYEAMYEVWAGSVIKGHFWWAWPVAPPGPNDTDYNPRNKPAQKVLENWQ